MNSISSKRFPLGDRPLSLAMIGLVDGNGHPWSWSAIFNGYDRPAMEACPYPAIPAYLGKEPDSAFGLGNARVTHIWTDDPAEAPKIARASRIDHVLARPEDAIGRVDAALIATDIGFEHVERCRPFIEAGVPVFVDKPMVDNAADLAVFNRWTAEGRPILSSSCMRYAKAFLPLRLGTSWLGTLRHITITMAKTWERYGIHALEAVYPITGPGYLSVQSRVEGNRHVAHLAHRNHFDVTVAMAEDLAGAFGVLQAAGTAGFWQGVNVDTFYTFKEQLAAFVAWLRSGTRPFPWEETDELMRMVAAGIRSRDEGGRVVTLAEIESP